eukprot:CAMPEP_0114340292 /NCGR_PEP_ID=MMETSP0101-20121206/8286_1 /TAXON_ID=38822 ORGANISM="Pteridomonas danica, Strain PT" /NCGR_SAMPLE_ID=MMETSP0101 /ASSEMBLY_ACC=CAM_ASM_000211 /LENGTH=571 /DNA_ID=CAMNT_0001473519 /DNA_START=2551 /DNA_END=4266 /DNA_ORIENTATION=+
MKQLSTVHPNIHPHIHPNVGHPHIGQIASPVPRPIINIGKSQGVMLPGQSQGPIGAPATTIRDEQQGVSFVSLEPKGKEGKEKEERHEVVIAAPDVSRSTSIEEANSESIKKEKKIERKRAKKMKLMRELDNTTQKDIKKKKKRVNNIEEVNLSIYSIIKAWTNILTAPLTLSIFVILFSMIQIYFWDAYAIKNWAIFTGDKPTTKTYGELEELSLWFQTQSMNYIVNGTLNTVSLRIHDLDNFFLLDSMYYRKIIGHGCFPFLLFVAFGLSIDNLRLWHFWINLHVLIEENEKKPKPPDITAMDHNETGHAHQLFLELKKQEKDPLYREMLTEESFRTGTIILTDDPQDNLEEEARVAQEEKEEEEEALRLAVEEGRISSFDDSVDSSATSYEDTMTEDVDSSSDGTYHHRTSSPTRSADIGSSSGDEAKDDTKNASYSNKYYVGSSNDEEHPKYSPDEGGGVTQGSKAAAELEYSKQSSSSLSRGYKVSPSNPLKSPGYSLKFPFSGGGKSRSQSQQDVQQESESSESDYEPTRLPYDFPLDQGSGAGGRRPIQLKPIPKYNTSFNRHL